MRDIPHKQNWMKRTTKDSIERPSLIMKMAFDSPKWFPNYKVCLEEVSYLSIFRKGTPWYLPANQQRASQTSHRPVSNERICNLQFGKNILSHWIVFGGSWLSSLARPPPARRIHSGECPLLATLVCPGASSCCLATKQGLQRHNHWDKQSMTQQMIPELNFSVMLILCDAQRCLVLMHTHEIVVNENMILISASGNVCSKSTGGFCF